MPARASARAVALISLVVALIAAGVAAYVWKARHEGLPAQGSAGYDQTTRHFYRGLAALQVGLIDDAIKELAQATELAPAEPASWANLGLAHLRLGSFDAASPPIERAAALAPQDSDIAFLWGRLDSARGRASDAVTHLQRAIALDSKNLRALGALIDEVENSGAPDASDQAQPLLDQLFAAQPKNVAVLVERARLAAKGADAGRLTDALERLQPRAAQWPTDAQERYRSLRDEAAASQFVEAARSAVFLRNVLAQVPEFQDDRRRFTPSAELIADPFTRFLRLPTPVAAPSSPDTGLTFAREPLGDLPLAPWTSLAVFSLDGTAPPAVFAANAAEIRRVDAAGATLHFPSGPSGTSPGANGLLALDWNNDFRMDIVAAGAGGVRLYLQASDGSFADATDRATSGAPGSANLDATGAWAADIDMDGDLDVIVGVRTADPVVLRNNGDGTWTQERPFTNVPGLLRFAWADLDTDGDPDAVLVDGGGTLHVFTNLQAGRFQEVPGPAASRAIAGIAVGDVDGDGVLDLVTVDATGAIRRASIKGEAWTQESWTSWSLPADPTGVTAVRLLLADVDNNGAIDLVATTSTSATVWLAGEDRTLRALPVQLDANVRQIVDTNGDGVLDLVGLSGGRAVRFNGRGTRGYHYQVIRPRAQTAAGDQRINSFGIGGDVEVRSGRLVQKQIIDDAVVHMGLGARTDIDVTRIVWPNGVPQAEFDPKADGTLVATQRLKGSCPWVFADDGTGLRFVTDFLWRSPLGLRINAQDTAGVTQTEDWVKIRGDQLKPRDGRYDVRISAELWETHFVDRVALMVVDHPKDVEVFVDERFAREAPRLAVHVMRPPQAVTRAWDQTGADVTDVLSSQDGRYLSTFARGPYQGVAQEHFVDVDLGAPIPHGVPTWLVAHGWIYPTDSSINVAIGQGTRVVPRGLSLEAQDARGRWVVVAPDLGFPAGKNKTILIDLGLVERAGIAGARRLRLRTNLEIYWDAIGWAAGAPAASVTPTRVEAASADLRYRGFSETRSDRHDVPETPLYERIANTAPRWRDLIGYYTRYGDVRDLLVKTDDRYVMMNAGDELRLSFPAPPPPADGWTRDFVLVGDGWVKDGDFNTSFSKTVLPLPEHGKPTYEGLSAAQGLDADPVYQRHRDDWETFHTRFVSPRTFLRALTLADEPDAR